MKKFVVHLIIVGFVVALSACGSSPGTGQTTPADDDSTSMTEPDNSDNGVASPDDNQNPDTADDQTNNPAVDQGDSDSDGSASDAPVDQGTNAGGNNPGNNGQPGNSVDANPGGDSPVTDPDQPVEDAGPDTANFSPLPSPPLTPPPGPDDEPVRASGAISTVTEFFLVRNPVRDLVDNFGTITDEEFASGPKPAVIYTPDSVNPATNSPPYFDNLNDVEVFAGQELQVVFKPLDPDGGVPGLFPNAIPTGARYVDNFNGTRSLIWTPLQPHVGITEFTITATDPEAPFYRTERTIRIKVKMPSDPSTIVNLPPVVNLLRDHTVRVNDPVVMYIKVDDQNGTIPTLEIANPPPGSTITPHYNEPRISILKFTPRVAERLEIALTARDAEDPTLTHSRTVALDVLSEEDFIRPGIRLRELAATKNILFGYASLLAFYERPDGAVYADIAAEEFNLVTTENSLKWDRLNPLPGEWRWAEADNLLAHAKARRQAVHGHTLIWHRQLPGWIKRSAVEERETHMREFIDRVLQRYGNDVPIWDVVNEALEEDGSFRQSTWFEAMGSSYIDTAFRQARESAPNATLLYNDYDISFNGPKAQGLLRMLQGLKDQETPIDGVGFQMHLDADFNRYEETRQLFQAVAEMDLDIYITELDVSIREGQTEIQQADVFAEVLSVCLEQPRCKAYQIWGFTDMYSWRRDFQPLIFDAQYQPKPAYFAIQQRLLEN